MEYGKPFWDENSNHFIDHLKEWDSPFCGAKIKDGKWVSENDNLELGWGPKRKGGDGKGHDAVYYDLPNGEDEDGLDKEYVRSGKGTVMVVLETAVVALDTQEILGSITWGYQIGDGKDGKLSILYATKASVSKTVKPEFREAVGRWNLSTKTGKVMAPGKGSNTSLLGGVSALPEPKK